LAFSSHFPGSWLSSGLFEHGFSNVFLRDPQEFARRNFSTPLPLEVFFNPAPPPWMNIVGALCLASWILFFQFFFFDPDFCLLRKPLQLSSPPPRQPTPQNHPPFSRLPCASWRHTIKGSLFSVFLLKREPVFDRHRPRLINRVLVSNTPFIPTRFPLISPRRFLLPPSVLLCPSISSLLLGDLPPHRPSPGESCLLAFPPATPISMVFCLSSLDSLCMDFFPCR